MHVGKLSGSARIAAINGSSFCRSIRRGIAGCMGLDSSTRARGRSAMETQVKAKEASSGGNLRRTIRRCAEAGVPIIGARAPACKGGNLRTTLSKATAGSGSFGDVAMNHGGVYKVAKA